MVTIIDAKRFPASEAWKMYCKQVAEVIMSQQTIEEHFLIKEIHLCDHVQMMLKPLLPHLEKKDTDVSKMKLLSDQKVWVPGVPVCASYIEGFVEMSIYQKEGWQHKLKKTIHAAITVFYSCEGAILQVQSYELQRISFLGNKTVDSERFLVRLKNSGWL